MQARTTVPAPWVASRSAQALPLLASLVLAACASAPRPAPPRAATPPPPSAEASVSPPGVVPAPPPTTAPAADGPSTVSPEVLAQLPDPEPRVEPVRDGGPNKPYQVQGQAYRPERGDPAMAERGIASWYGRFFHGRRTASGEVYDMHALTAAHKTMPIPSYARVVNPANGREVIVRINDRGPFIAGRIIDLSYAAAVKLGTAGGVAPVEVHRITHEAIRSGAWRRGEPAATTVAEATSTVVVPAARAVAVATQPVAAPPVAPAPRAELPAPPNPAPTTLQPAYTEPARGFWLQLGAFAQGAGAQDFRRKVEAQVGWLAPLLAVFDDKGLHRLQAGPYASRPEAQAAQERLRADLQLVAVVVQRR
jgi:rare lipoprotein A